MWPAAQVVLIPMLIHSTWKSRSMIWDCWVVHELSHMRDCRDIHQSISSKQASPFIDQLTFLSTDFRCGISQVAQKMQVNNFKPKQYKS